jgi:hypothetical protein
VFLESSTATRCFADSTKAIYDNITYTYVEIFVNGSFYPAGAIFVREVATLARCKCYIIEVDKKVEYKT